MRSCATDMPLQLEFDKDSGGQSRNGWRSNLFYTICLLHSSQVLLPTGFHHHTLQGFTQVMPSKGTQTIWKASEWNEELESNVWCQKTMRNMTTKDNPGTLPINLYAADYRTVQLQSQCRIGKQQRLFTNKARLSVLKLIPVILVNCP